MILELCVTNEATSVRLSVKELQKSSRSARTSAAMKNEAESKDPL